MRLRVEDKIKDQLEIIAVSKCEHPEEMDFHFT